MRIESHSLKVKSVDVNFIFNFFFYRHFLQVDLKEANFLRLQSKYLVLLTNLNKIRADNSGFVSQRSDATLATNEQERSEIIKSLLQEVMQKTDQINLKG